MATFHHNGIRIEFAIGTSTHTDFDVYRLGQNVKRLTLENRNVKWEYCSDRTPDEVCAAFAAYWTDQKDRYNAKRAQMIERDAENAKYYEELPEDYGIFTYNGEGDTI